MAGRKEQKAIIKRRNGFCFCDKYPSFCEEWAEQNGYTLDQVKDAISFYFEAVNGAYEHPYMPSIYMKYVGTYAPKPVLLRTKLERDFRKYHLSQITEQGLRRTIQEAWPVRKRLQKETSKEKDRLGRRKQGKGITAEELETMREQMLNDIFGDDIEQNVTK